MPTELEVQTRITAAYINTRPVALVFTPNETGPDGSGGQKLTALPPRPPQVVRFLEASADFVRRISDIGSQYTQAAILLCLPDVAIAVDDTFFWDGSTWRVESLEFPNDYSVRAAVLRYGRTAVL